MTKKLKSPSRASPAPIPTSPSPKPIPTRAAALPDLRRRVRRDRFGRGRSRHDPDREFGRRPGRRYPSSAAAIRPAHHRRIVPADPPPADGAARRQAGRHQDRAEPRPRARPVPQHHPQARPQADRRGRYRRLRPHRRRTRRQVLRGDRLHARRRDLRARHAGATTSRTRPTTPRASSSCRASRTGPSRAPGRGHHFVFRVRNMPAALYKALGGFATNGVNMTKLESYMVDGEFFATQFYADVDGHPEDSDLSSRWRNWRSSRAKSASSASIPAIRSGRPSAKRRSELADRHSGDAQHRTRSLKIPGSAPAGCPGMTVK